MRRQARSVLTGLLVLCCAAVALVPTACVRADSSGSAGAFVASVFTSVRDFFVSGQALKMLETATQAVNAFAVRLFLHLATLVVPILGRLVTGFSATPELVAIWMFWKTVVLALVVLILALRPRRTVRKRLPKVSPRVAGQGENTIEFGLVEQGPKPSSATSLDQLARTREKTEGPSAQEPAARSAVVEESSHTRLESLSVPEIALEPLGFFGGTDALPTVPVDAAAVVAPDMPSLLEFVPLEEELPAPQAVQLEPITTTPADAPSESLLTPPQGTPSTQELPREEVPEPFSEPDLRPIGQEAPVQPVEPESTPSETVVPLDRPLPSAELSAAEEVLQVEEVHVPEAPVTPQAAPTEEPRLLEEMNTPVPEEVSPAGEPLPTVPETPAEVPAAPEVVPVEVVPVEVVPVEVVPVETENEPTTAKLSEPIQPTPSSADLLSRLLADEESFQQTMVAAGATAAAAAPAPPFGQAPATKPAPQPSIFSGNVELDTLLQDGLVADAGALAQLFRGGYRNRISKLAVSAKDLQNVPDDMRQIIKLTVVALSPIELSIARDLAMRLEAPGFVGEALLVTKKMGYQNYLTTYKNISKNYKDVSIVETVNLKAPEISAESGEDLISFS